MRKFLSILFVLQCMLVFGQTAEFKKPIRFQDQNAGTVSGKILNKPGTALPYADPIIFNSGMSGLKSMPSSAIPMLKKDFLVLEKDEEGMPSRLSFHIISPRNADPGPAFWAEQLGKVFDPQKNLGIDWLSQSDQYDELNIRHLKFQQFFDGLAVLGCEYLLHLYPDGKTLAHGKFSQPDQIRSIRISLEQATEIAKNALLQKGIAFAEQTGPVPKFIKTGLAAHQTGYVQHPENKEWRLVYELEYYPASTHKYLLWIDAENGEVMKLRKDQCQLHYNTNNCSFAEEICSHGDLHSLPDPQDAETTTARDLFDINRTLRVWRDGSFQYFIDGSRPMFKPGSFKLDDPVGAIWTLDGLNSNENNIRVGPIRSNSNIWAKNAVSAHYNAGLAYEYYLNTHARNSINGKGGTIISIINITEAGGGGLDNAFWNGEAMFYGNGGTAFNSLAKSLDVAGHEMSHGVIQSTANLAYENESGAINESFADIFGCMIDRDDWKLGEDVVKLSAFPSGALRDMSNPHNGAQSNDFGRWQPKHVSEQYKGTLDNGGVHINSGIPNHAFYLFVKELAKSSSEEQGKVIAEKIFYRALSNYLTRSSNFKDLRNAVEQACIDLHGNNSNVHNAARFAFDQVGIGSSGNPGGGGQQYQNDLPVNPGTLFAVCTDDNNLGVYLINIQTSQIFQLSSRAISSKPSVTDNGSEIYYVGADSRLYGLFLNQTTKIYEEVILDTDPIYRNAVISKDGRLLAVLYDQEENKIHVFDWSRQVWKTFTLTNPTTSTGGNATSNVRYADFMDFEHSGEYLMYDALSKLDQNTGGSYEYWDIGFLRVWNRSTNNFGDGHIEKLFSDLPENTSIGNPSFSKNSPYIIAFDYLEEDLFGNTFYILGANVETGTVGEIAANRDDTGYPNYSVDDKFIMYNGEDNGGNISIKFKQLAANKIQSGGNEQLFISEARWGSFFANGNRVLIKNEDLESIHDLEVYPVPFDKTLNISLNSNQNQELNIQLINSLGVEILKEKRTLESGKNQLQLNVPELNNGVYFLKLMTREGMVSVAVMKG
ncbi:MAG: M4 family metallopeptidase [Saprospiraceae bacterium]|nr:M4 family metallopeptidase [Saprospiraceae bacterium]